MIFAGRDLFYSRRFDFKSTIFAGKEATTPVAAKGEGAAYYQRGGRTGSRGSNFC